MKPITHTNSKGRVFTLLGQEPYTRKSGTTTVLLRWRGVCAREGCGASFDVRTPVVFGGTASFERKHCDAHKLTWAEIGRLGREHQQARKPTKKRKVSDAEVAEIRKDAANGFTPRDLALLYPLTANTIREIVAGRRR